VISKNVSRGLLAIDGWADEASAQQTSPCQAGLLRSLLLRSANQRLHQGEALSNCRGEAAKYTLVCAPEYS
jgi:hypothetical protein